MKSALLKSATLVLFALMSAAPTSRADEKDTLNAADVKFVKHEAAAGMAVVKCSELGVKKAKSADVKSLAETLVKDHTAVNTELGALAKQKGVELSTVLDPEASEDIQKLEKLDGAEFDKKFLAQIVSGHKKCITKFTVCSEEAKNADLKAWATKILPTLKAHLAKAEALTEK